MGGERRSVFVTKRMTRRRVMTMICMIPVTSTKTKLKYIVQSIMVKATLWKNTRKGQRGSQEIVTPRIQTVDGGGGASAIIEVSQI
jgi:hypothetical protein